MQQTETAEQKEEMRISKIKNGTVIDHISPGCSLKVLEILGILPGTSAKVSFVMNILSSKMDGKKDMVKIEGKELTKRETDKITVVAPGATINIIRNYEKVKKYQVELPEEIIDIIKCPRPTCITNDQKETGNIKTIFTVISRKPIIIKCRYCEFQIDEKDISKYVKF